MKKGRNDIVEYLYNRQVVRAEKCSDEETQSFIEMLDDGKILPDDVLQIAEKSFVKTDITDEEIDQLLSFFQTKHINTIKKCCILLVTIIILVFCVFPIEINF